MLAINVLALPQAMYLPNLQTASSCSQLMVSENDLYSQANHSVIAITKGQQADLDL